MNSLSIHELEKLQIYILSRDRPNFLKETIDSVLNQDQLQIEYELIISDNSENSDVRKMVSQYYKNHQLKYISVNPPTSAKEHFQMIVSKLKSEFAILLHDDDVLCSNYLKNMYLAIKENNVVAVGCNAKIFKNNISKATIRTHRFDKPKKFYNERNFLIQYLPGNGGNAPFPSYIYRTKYLKKIFLNLPIKGKHADAAILSSLLEFGEILWLEKSLMYYRVHDSNDSVLEKVADRLHLMNYMKKKDIDKNSINFLLYRLLFWFRWLKLQQLSLKNLKNRRYRLVLTCIISKTLKLFGRRNFWVFVYQRYQRK